MHDRTGFHPHGIVWVTEIKKKKIRKLFYLDVKHIKIKQGLNLTYLYMYEQPNALCLKYCILSY